MNIYLYAISLYSSNPDMSQREAAGITRAKFKLETFSHTTLGRAFKAFEKSIDEIVQPGETPPRNVPAAPGRFPSVHDTFERRKNLLSFLGDLSKKSREEIDVETIKLVKRQYDKHKRLLL